MPHPATRWLHCGLPERSAKDVKSAMDPNPQVVKAAPGCFVRMASDNLRRNCIAAAVLVVAILAAVNGTFLRADRGDRDWDNRSEEHTSELQSLRHLVCRLLLEKKTTKIITYTVTTMKTYSESTATVYLST